MAQRKRVLDGRYEVGPALGEGGMAKVFKGTDRVLGRTVAIKVLAPQFVKDAQFVKRFQREAQAAASLNHPNVVSIYDTGSKGAVHYIVMEHVQGTTLADVIKAEGPLLPERVVEIGEAVARALAAAHGVGIVHRDVKPGNIMLTKNGEVKVMDFGIARAISSDSVTQTATILGTAAYLSPEQAKGDQVDGRSDIYSLGCVLYELLTGTAPFTGETPVSVAYKHVNEPANPPSRQNSDVPPGLEAVVMKALAKNPINRYQDAEELLEDLERLRSGMPVHATPVLADQQTRAIDRTQVVSRPMDQTAVLEAPPRGSERGGRGLFTALVTILILVVLGVAGYFLVTTLLTKAPIVTVPDVRGNQEEAAVRQLEALDLDVEITPRFQRIENPRPEGIVFAQNPPPETEVEEGSTVEIFVSRGTEQVEVPSLVNMTEEEARQELEPLNLVLDVVATEPSETVTEGEIIRQDPAPGERVPKGSEVDVVVSSGRETTFVPHVICQPRDEAREEIEGQGLVYEEVGFETSDCPFDTIARQDPEAGEEVEKGSTVQVWISTGPEESPFP